MSSHSWAARWPAAPGRAASKTTSRQSRSGRRCGQGIHDLWRHAAAASSRGVARRQRSWTSFSRARPTAPSLRSRGGRGSATPTRAGSSDQCSRLL